MIERKEASLAECERVCSLTWCLLVNITSTLQ